MADATFSDLQAAINGFNTALTDYATNSAIQSATQQVQQLNQMGLADAEKRQAASNLANQLALQLTGIGASGTQIQSAFSAIAPKQFTSSSQLYGEGLLTGNEPMQQQAQEWKKFETQDKMRLAELSLAQKSLALQQKQGLADNRDFTKAIQKNQDKYANWNNKLQPVETKLAMLEEGLIRNDNALIQGAAPTIIAKSMGEVGALTEADKAPFTGSLALSERIQQFFSTAGTGKLSDSNRRTMLQLVRKLRAANENWKKGNAGLLGRQLKVVAKRYGADISDDEAMTYITGMAPGEDMTTVPMIPTGPRTTVMGGAGGTEDLGAFLKPLNK